MLQRQKRIYILERLKRLTFYQQQLNYNFLKFLIKTNIFSIQIKIFLIFYFTVLYNFPSKTQHKNLCFNTSYRRSINTWISLNRMQAIQQISNRKLPGFSLAKW